jgi:NDP-sugar pyrophosphorylase family protein
VRAIIMAGGLGTRLAPYTSVLPKPLMPLTDRPIIDVILRQLARAEIEHVTISVGHLGGLIESWVRHTGDYGVPIDFHYESEPLGTAGALGAIPGLEGTFLAMNGDILTTLDFQDLAREHASTASAAIVAVKERVVDIDYGVVHVDENRHIVRLEEKPRISFNVSMGVYAFDARIRGLIEPGERIDFPDLLLRAIADGQPVSTYPFDGYWRDIGNREDYAAAVDDFAADPGRFLGGS